MEGGREGEQCSSVKCEKHERKNIEGTSLAFFHFEKAIRFTPFHRHVRLDHSAIKITWGKWPPEILQIGYTGPCGHRLVSMAS